MEKHDSVSNSTPPANDAMASAIVAFDAVVSDPSWMSRPIQDFPPQFHPFNAPEMLFYSGGKKLGARLVAAESKDQSQIASDCQRALFELVSSLRARVASDSRVESLAAQTAPWTNGADLLIESSGVSFIAGFLEGGLLRESQDDLSLGFGREMDMRWRTAQETLYFKDAEPVRALVEAEADSSRALATFLAAALPDDTHFNAGVQIGLLGHVAACERYPRGLPALRSMNRDLLGRFFQGSTLVMRLAEDIGADARPLMGSGMLSGQPWNRFTDLLGGFPSKRLMLLEAEASLGALGALCEAQEIGLSTAHAPRSPSSPGL